MRWVEIANVDLRESDIPPCDAEWDKINEFALSFNGYDAYGGFEGCAKIAESTLKAYSSNKGVLISLSLTELRATLFFMQRSWRWACVDVKVDKMGVVYIIPCDEPYPEEMHSIRDVVEAIRRKVRSKDLG